MPCASVAPSQLRLVPGSNVESRSSCRCPHAEQMQGNTAHLFETAQTLSATQGTDESDSVRATAAVTRYNDAGSALPGYRNVTVLRVDVGFVSENRELVEFFAHVFELDELPPITLEPGTVHRLQAGDAHMKVMCPSVRPTRPAPASPFYAASGLRYLTIWVDDIERVVARAVQKGGRVERGPMELVGGVRFAVLEDPEGNAIEVAQRT